MTFQNLLQIEDGNALAGVQQVLRALLESKRIDAVLAPCRAGKGDALGPALITDPEQIANCDPLAPVMPLNLATLLARLTVSESGRRVGAVLRACEWRAVVELAKLRQVNLAGVVAIGVDCLGAYSAADYAQIRRDGGEPDALWRGAPSGEPTVAEGYALRTACQMCEHPVAAGPSLPAVRIGLIGLDYPHQLLVESDEELPLAGDVPAEAILRRRAQAIADLESRRTAEREHIFAGWRAHMNDSANLLEEFAACVHCENCMVACPICYCKECIFRTPTFDHESEQYFRWAERRGALRMPTDSLLFHLTRLNHMATSCVGCGACESACPNHLPVATLFRATAQRVQALFGYEAGRSLDDELPLLTFREDELPDV